MIVTYKTERSPLLLLLFFFRASLLKGTHNRSRLFSRSWGLILPPLLHKGKEKPQHTFLMTPPLQLSLLWVAHFSLCKQVGARRWGCLISPGSICELLMALFRIWQYLAPIILSFWALNKFWDNRKSPPQSQKFIIAVFLYF